MRINIIRVEFKQMEFLMTKSTILLSSLLTLASTSALASFADQSANRIASDKEVSVLAIKENYINMAHASLEDSLKTANELLINVNEFLANPSQKTLDDTKAAYKVARIPYQQAEILRWDTDYTNNPALGKNQSPVNVDEWEGQVNAWPLDEQAIDYVEGNQNAGIINQTNGQKIDIDYLIAQNGVGGEANVTTGFHAIEFLLWGQDLNGTKAGAGKRSANDFQTDKSGKCSASNCDRRRDYLLAATQLLVNDIDAMSKQWDPSAKKTAGTLAQNFYFSDTTIEQMLFAMKSMAVAELASARMYEGLDSQDPEQEHDCFSDLSHVAIYYNYQGIRNLFYGGYEKLDGSLVSGASLADYINQQDKKTFSQFDNALNSIEKNMAVIYNAGERKENNLRFDQIIGQVDTDTEKQAGLNAVYQLTELETTFNKIEELLSLQALTIDGDGD